MLVAENNMPGRPTRGNFGFLKIGRTTGPILNYEHMLKNKKAGRETSPSGSFFKRFNAVLRRQLFVIPRYNRRVKFTARLYARTRDGDQTTTLSWQLDRRAMMREYFSSLIFISFIYMVFLFDFPPDMADNHLGALRSLFEACKCPYSLFILFYSSFPGKSISAHAPAHQKR